ncbi:hypothetical protein [Bradyrhizobium tropiciagri]|uniref:hypothetical protein n=1 Tax=Bradyrhizobium tropiciagri TaxID=312253 RepID=UPI0010099970|nr:hypothetical protein [Bradyrhizobium tropiciagri]
MISRDLLGLHGRIGEVEGAFRRWPGAITLATAAIGVGLATALDSAINKAGKFNDELIRLRNMGDAVARVVDTPGFKAETMRIGQTYGLPAATVARLYGLPSSMLGAEEAQLVLEPNAKLARAWRSRPARALTKLSTT